MRTRTRSQPVVLDGQLHRAAIEGGVNDGYVIFGTSTPGTSFDDVFETITDELPGYAQFGSCLHSRKELRLYPNGSTHRKAHPFGTQVTVRSGFFLASLYHNVLRTWPIVPISDYRWEAWSQEALDACLPTFSEPGESLVNSLIEIKQLSSLFSFWKKRRGPLSTITNAHLMVNFGFLPLFGDVGRVAGALHNFWTKLSKLRQDAGKPKTHHYRRAVDVGTLSGKVSISGLDDNGQFYREVQWSTAPVYTATVDFVYNMPPELDTWLGQSGAFLDTIGFQLDPSIIWNAIPYSFVIDWFFNVGEWLHGLRLENVPIPATVTDFCHAVKYAYRGRITFVPTTEFDPSSGSILVADQSYSRYERRRDIPSTGLFDSTVKTPNWKQLSLGAALIGQRVLKKRQ